MADDLEETTTPPTPKPHSPRLLALARDLGIDHAEASTYTASELLGVIHAIQAQQANSKPAAAKEIEADPPIDWGVDDDGVPLKESDLAKHQVRDKRKLHELSLAFGKQSKEFKEFRDSIAERDEKREKAEQQRAVNQHWENFDKLCAQHPDLFGKGTRSSLDPKSNEYKRRANLAASCTDPSRSLEEQFFDALDAVHGRKPGKRRAAPEVDEDEDALPEDAPVKVQAKGKNVFPSVDEEKDRRTWDRSNGTSLGSSRRSPEIDEPNEKRAAKGVKKIMRDRGIDTNGANREEEELLPD